MKSVKLYRALKALLVQCVDERGLPQKPTIKVLYKARDIVNKYEKEVKLHENILITPPPPPLPPEGRLVTEGKPPQKPKN